MYLANVSLDKPIPGMSLCFSETKKVFPDNWREIIDYGLRIWEAFSRRPRFLAPVSFPGDRLNIEIYTDARPRTPLETDTIS